MWKKINIDGLNKEYLINENGDIFDIKENKLRKQTVSERGYLKVSFYVNGKYKKFFIHRLVMIHFNPIDNMENLQVNHINGDKSDNRIENLEWVTPSQNTRHANKKGKGHQMSQNGESNSMSKLTTEQVIEIIKETNKPNRRTDQKISEDYGVTRKTISNIRNNITWKHINRDIS